MSATTSDRAPGFLGRIRRFRPLAVTWHEVFSPLSAEECAERLWQTAQTEGTIPWQFCESRATRWEQETRRPEVVGTVTGAALSCSVTGRQPPPSILASGQFRPTPDGTLVAVAFGPSRAHVLLLIVATALYAVFLGALGVLFLVAQSAVAFDATRVLPTFNADLLLLILIREWRMASDRERARCDGEELLAFLCDSLQASIRAPQPPHPLS